VAETTTTAETFRREFTFSPGDYTDVCRILAEREQSVQTKDADTGKPIVVTNGELLASVLREWEAWSAEKHGKQPKTHRCPECGRPMEVVGSPTGRGTKVKFRCGSCQREVWEQP
jgi:uncharacterized protein with PIN domain